MRNTLLIPILGSLLIGAAALAGPREAQWKAVDEAVAKGRPQSAIEALLPILEAAKAEKAYPEAIKAIARKIKLEGDIQGRKAEERITRLEAELAAAPEAMKPVLQAVLANWYWHYFQQNRWRFMQRTQSAAPSGTDILTWDLARILAEIDKRFVTALAGKEALRAVPIAAYDDLLVKGNAPDTYRPTLYDFLAQDALAFYSAGEQAGARAENAFTLSADSPAFDAADVFVAWKIEAGDDFTPEVRALRLFQELLAFHKGDKDPAALIDVDLARLEYAHNTAFGENKSARYKAALKKLTETWADHEISARALCEWASVLQQENDLVEAHRLAARGAEIFPDSVGGRRCYNLVQQLEARSASVTTERIWNEPLPEIRVRYRNVGKVYFRLVAADWEEQLKAPRYHVEYLDQNDLRALLGREPAKAWNADLPATPDYQEREEALPAPRDLKPGFYFLLASHDAAFSDKNNVVSYSALWVSDLALVMRSAWGSGEISGFVLEARTGEPLEGAEVRTWRRENNNARSPGPSAKTDRNGLFRIAGGDGRGHILLATHQGRAVSAAQDYQASRQDQQTHPYVRTIFFTDRSLYRPGQTIEYKGLCLRVDQAADNYAVLPGQAVTVIFSDSNGKEVARQARKANDYGSFSGNFTAPRDRLMGRMMLRVEAEPSGNTWVNVEEYKRPKFKVAIDAPAAAARLGGPVATVGHAVSYTGAAVDGAEVRYRVVREVRYPIWWCWRCWWCPPDPGASQEIAHGTERTGADGSFSIRFTATPDRSVAESSEPTFRYTVHADVTDPAGETRSGERVVNLGYTALSAALTADEWQVKGTPVAIKIATQTLDGDGQAAEGTLKIHRLKEPAAVERAPLAGAMPFRTLIQRGMARAAERPQPAPKPDPAEPNSWELAEVVQTKQIQTSTDGTVAISVDLPPGLYRAVLETQDRFKKKVTALLPLRVLDSAATQCALKLPHVFAAPVWSVEPGANFTALWGSGYESARAYVELEHRGKILREYWTDPKHTQELIEQTVTEAMRGGFTLRVTMVRDNRAYLESRHVEVPWSNKQLEITWEHFTSKLQPAQSETWTAVIRGHDAKMAAAELVAALYDESLDAYLMHQWQQEFGVFRRDESRLASQFENIPRILNPAFGSWPVETKDGNLTYRSYPPELMENVMMMMYRGNGGGAPPRPMMRMAAVNGMAMEDAAAVPMAAAMAPTMASDRMMAEKDKDGPGWGTDKQGAGAEAGGPGGSATPAPNLDAVTARKNLQETAFFFPQLLSDENGVVKLQFTMPEALTQWKFMGFAHDRELRSGYLQASTVTAKDLMVQPNAPRFLREGDALEFTVKVLNQSSARQQGTVRLTLSDARTLKSVDEALKNAKVDQAFDIPAKESRTFAWRLSVPDDLGFLQYKAVASTGKISDGEEGYLPVLARRILVTESLPLPVRGAQTKKFRFEKLAASGASGTLRHQNLSVQMVSHPAWYAIMALPYLMESPNECSEQTFNRLYANVLARHIANADPKIRRVFDLWKGTPALDSPLEKNQDLKSVMLDETPWVQQSLAESEARRNVGVLFDANRLDTETARLVDKLVGLQLGDGRWPWFPGGQGDDFITLYITTGMGRLRNLGAKGLDMAMAVKALQRLDVWVDETYRDILKNGHKEGDNMSPTIALYLYGRSFFLGDRAIAANQREAVDYFLAQAKAHWLKQPRLSQAHLAVALQRFGAGADVPADILKSLKEFSESNEEMGMFWRDTEMAWWWYRAPIETQAMMIEVFDEVGKDAAAVENCKVWLLKQKQTQDWKTTKATADAIYALLLRGTYLLASDELVEVSLGGAAVKPRNVEAGTGFYEERFVRGEIKPAMGEIVVKKVDPGVSWGSVHWQYLEDVAKVTPHEGTPLTLKKALFVKENTAKGPTLRAVKGPLKVGDELVVRIELRTDRDMEYVHMKDQRGSGTEPVNVLSQQQRQDGLSYYESTRDTASHFFISYLPKGTYVFEYSLRVAQRGQYQSGMAEIQCMYAPEFNSHSESIPLTVQ